MGMQETFANSHCRPPGQDADSKQPRCTAELLGVDRSSFAFDLDYPGIEEWKRWALGILWRPMSSDCDLPGSHQGAPKVTRIKSQDELNIENKCTHLPLYHGGKQFRYHQLLSRSEDLTLEDGSILSLLLFWCLYVEIICPWRISDLR